MTQGNLQTSEYKKIMTKENKFLVMQSYENVDKEKCLLAQSVRNNESVLTKESSRSKVQRYMKSLRDLERIVNTWKSRVKE